MTASSSCARPRRSAAGWTRTRPQDRTERPRRLAPALRSPLDWVAMIRRGILPAAAADALPRGTRLTRAEVAAAVPRPLVTVATDFTLMACR